ncbi:MAG: nitroreductase family protein [Muribaculaceae bacterium]|nr:nitroreductase family protein [Muribaculaceae bacterium]
MENLHQLLIERHSIRRYTDRPVDADDVKLILQAGLLAPSSKSKRPWQFVVVENRDILERLAQCKDFGTKPISTAAFGVVVAVDSALSDCFVEDASIAAVLMQLQAADLGLGSCWIQVRNRFTADGTPAEDIVRETLGIPENITIECIVTVGHKDEERRPVDPDKLLWEKVHIENWRPQE